jgi:hypothetical protein
MPGQGSQEAFEAVREVDRVLRSKSSNPTDGFFNITSVVATEGGATGATLGSFVWGAIGAIAPEIVRWYRIAGSETPGEWRRASYWFATVAYVLLGGVVASLVAQPNPFAAFVAGVATEFTVLGALAAGPRFNPGSRVEELAVRPANSFMATLVALRSHAVYLTTANA